MRTMLLRMGLLVVLSLGISILWPEIGGARPARQIDDPVKQGEYLTAVAMCVFCHTPFKEQFVDVENLGPDEVRTAAFSVQEMLDESRLFAGGHEIPLGPAGVVISRNLTPDVETGLGAWTDEEIKNAIRLGISRDGHRLFPVMPYLLFNNMAESDLDAIVAYLRTLPPIRNEIPHELEQHVPVPDLPPLSIPDRLVAPDAADAAARGEYLMSAVVLCTLCHTPVDEVTGEPIPGLFLSGGQPFEGPWGIVYGGNLTPHEETGIRPWSDTDIKRLLRNGIRLDGRRSVLMPWYYTSKLTPEDADAIVYYLRNNVAPVDREVPAPALIEGLFEYVDIPTEDVTGPSTDLSIGIGAAVVLVIAAGAFWLVKRRGSVGIS